MLKNALRHCDQNRRRFVSELSKLVAIPSCSFPGFPEAEVARCAKATAAYLRRSGLEHVRVLRVPGGHPYVYGDWLHAPGKPTVLLYAHLDVQPPGRDELWKSPPYKPTERGGRLYGRGAADDKAGICVHASSIESWLKTSGRMPVNVKVLIEGEEEIGSRHLQAFCRKYSKLMQADLIVIGDTGNQETGLPSVTTSLRGLAAFEVTVSSGEHSVHSGCWGGPMPDPVQALSKMIASLTDREGRIAIPGIYKKVRPLTAAERKDYASLRYGDRNYRKEVGVLPGVQLVGGQASPLVKLWRLPALSVNAIQASSKEGLSNIVNEKAWCHVGIRIVPDMCPDRTVKLMKAHLRRHAPWGVKVEFGPQTTAPWWTTDTTAPAFRAVRQALSKGYGRKAVFIGSGGSIPFIDPFSRMLGGAPAALIGVEDQFSNPHSENESVHLGDLHKAVRASVHLYDELAKLAA